MRPEAELALMDAVAMILSHTKHPVLGDCHSSAPYAELKRQRDIIQEEIRNKVRLDRMMAK
jgi:hypothetical protein